MSQGDRTRLRRIYPSYRQRAIPINFDGGTIIVSGSGGMGDPDASYVVMSLTGSLTNERQLTMGNGLLMSDAGSGAGVTLYIDNSIVATVSGATFTRLSGSLQRTSAGLSYLVGAGSVSITSQSNGQIIISGSSSTPDPNVVAFVSGTTFTGGVRFQGGLTGSLTHLPDGTTYLVGGSGITLTSQSNGQVVINAGDAASRLTPLDANHLHAWELTEVSGSTTFVDTGTSSAKVDLIISNTAAIKLGAAGIFGDCAFFGMSNTPANVTAMSASVPTAAFSDLPGNNFTIEAWANPSSVGTSAVNYLFSCDFANSANFQFGLNGSSSDNLTATGRNTGGTFVTPASIAALFRTSAAVSSWHYYAITFNGARLIMYADGEVVSNTALSGSISWTNNGGGAISSKFCIGNQSNGTAAFTGRISRVRMSNIVRSQDYFRTVFKKAMLYT